jgi:hypothetical protein
MFPKLLEIKALANYTLWLEYDDGTIGTVDLTEFTKIGVFKAIKNPNFFQTVHIDKETDAIAWNEDIDLCPDSMFLKIKGLTAEQYKSMLYATT